MSVYDKSVMQSEAIVNILEALKNPCFLLERNYNIDSYCLSGGCIFFKWNVLGVDEPLSYMYVLLAVSRSFTCVVMVTMNGNLSFSVLYYVSKILWSLVE